MALEIIINQEAKTLLHEASVVRATFPALRERQGALPRVTQAVLHAKRHAPRRVPRLGAVRGEDLCRDEALLRLSPLALPGVGDGMNGVPLRMMRKEPCRRPL